MSNTLNHIPKNKLSALKGLQEILEFYGSSGLDFPILEQSVCHLEHSEKNLPKCKKKAPHPKDTNLKEDKQNLTLPVSPHSKKLPLKPAKDQKVYALNIPNKEQAQNAENQALQAFSLADLQKVLENFTGFTLRKNAKHTCFSKGVAGSKILLIDDIPRIEEEKEARPFAGEAGKLLAKMLQAIGLSEEKVYMISLAPWRAPGGRELSRIEMQICLPFLYRHIALARPKIILTMGASPSAIFTKGNESFLKIRGKWLDYTLEEKYSLGTTEKKFLMPMFSPRHLLEHSGQKKFAWLDLLAVQKKLETV